MPLYNEPMTVQSRGRLYTDERQRRSLDVNPTPYGRKTPVQVALVDVDRHADWDGIYQRAASFDTTLGYYGSIQIPIEVRQRMDIEEGDDLRVTIVATEPSVEVDDSYNESSGESTSNEVDEAVSQKVEVGEPIDDTATIS